MSGTSQHRWSVKGSIDDQNNKQTTKNSGVILKEPNNKLQQRPRREKMLHNNPLAHVLFTIGKMEVVYLPNHQPKLKLDRALVRTLTSPYQLQCMYCG